MKLAVTNLALPEGLDPQGYGVLREMAVDGVEIAPTRVRPWDEWRPEVAADIRRTIEDAGLAVPALQSLLFGVPGVQLLGSEAEFLAMEAHLRKVAAIGAVLGAPIGVFGSPKQRRVGDLDPQAAMALGRERFHRLAAAVWEEGFSLGLEPVPPVYGGEFATTAAEVIDLVSRVSHPGLKVHLDFACIRLGGGSVPEAISAATSGPGIGHFHVSEPNLGAFDAPDPAHEAAGRALRAAAPEWISIEMLCAPATPVEAVKMAVDFTRRVYLGHET